MKYTRTVQICFALAITASVGLATAQVAPKVGSPATPGQGTDTQPTKENPTVDAEPDSEKPTPSPKVDEELHQRVTFLLSGYEYFPTRDDLDKAGSAEDVTAVLMSIVRDDDSSAMHRLRAIDALGFYELQEVAEFLSKLTKGAKAADLTASARHSSLMQHHAITALARSQRDGSLPALETFLVGDDLQLKLTAVVALGKHGKADGRERLQKLVKSDDNKLVQREARKYLR